MNFVRFLQIAAQADGVFKVGGAVHNDARQVNGRRRGLFQPKYLETMRRFFHVLENVIQLGGQGVDVLAVERCNKSTVEGFDDLYDLYVANRTAKFAKARS